MQRRTSLEHNPILKKAEEFHGHLGPFLVIGVRMGLTGLDRLNAPNAGRLTITAFVPPRIPFSCIVDGLQITTGCTTGNRKLRLKNSARIEAEFERKDTEQKTVVALNPTILGRLKIQLTERKLRDEELRELASKIASMSEHELLVTP